MCVYHKRISACFQGLPPDDVGTVEIKFWLFVLTVMNLGF